jgi:hypothetical protein
LRRFAVAFVALVFLTTAVPAQASFWRQLIAYPLTSARKAWLADPTNEPRSKHPLKWLRNGFVPGWSEPLSRSNVGQGIIKDCWLLSAMPGILKINPSMLSSLVELRPDGNYDVTLYLGKKTRDENGVVHRAPITIGVTPTFPMEHRHLVYASAPFTQHGQVLTIALIEKAYAKWEGRYEGRPPLVSRGISGRLSPAFHALLPTGESETHFMLVNKRATIGRDLVEATAKRRPVTALLLTTLRQSNRRLFEELGLTVRFHHYAVTSYDPATELLELQDPHGKVIRNVPLAAFKRLFTTYVVGPEIPTI